MSDEKLKKYKSELTKANTNFYLEQTQIDSLVKNKIINPILGDFSEYKSISGRARLSINMQKILYGFLLEKDKYICTAFRMVSTDGEQSIS